MPPNLRAIPMVLDPFAIKSVDAVLATHHHQDHISPADMDEKAVNYLIRTPGGNIYHGGDSHYSSGFAKHGKACDIDVAIGAFAENPVGVQDKMTSLDILRMAEALRCKVIIPVHYDVWTNFMADVNEIRVLYHMRTELKEDVHKENGQKWYHSAVRRSEKRWIDIGRSCILGIEFNG